MQEEEEGEGGSMCACAASCRLTPCVNIEIDGREIDVHVVEEIES